MEITPVNVGSDGGQVAAYALRKKKIKTNQPLKTV
jgi:hypothetical protein